MRSSPIQAKTKLFSDRAGRRPSHRLSFSNLKLADGRVIKFRAVMGVLNVTPDSFSDGGRYLDPDRAVEHALAMEAAGAPGFGPRGETSRAGGGGGVAT